MHKCKCSKSENGYYQWKCVAGKSLECKLKLASLKLLKLLTKKLLMGKKWIKLKKKKERVYHDLSFKDVYLKLVSMKKLYITRKCEVYNDAFTGQK